MDQDHFRASDFYLSTDFHFFCGTFYVLECKRMIRSNFAGGVSEHGDMEKGSFQMMV